MHKNISRRNLLLGAAALSAVCPIAMAQALATTPRQTAGPFYPPTLPLDDDNDLTTVTGRIGTAKGLITELSGRILDINNHPIEGLRIEIWQCDANGRYRHPDEHSLKAIDENFQGHGHSVTDANGRYRFRTIRPVPYPGRTPHIHVAVFAQGEPPFITQLYAKGEPLNESDFLFKRVPTERRHLVLASFRESHHPGAALEASFDIILNRTDGTPQSG